ncbi:hypothetical protein [Terrimonas alba]|uniref:hypothetical protein n=1 Tax=Terrimonas alba TaxID=3349636 RepID=UPI0035F48DB0
MDKSFGGYFHSSGIHISSTGRIITPRVSSDDLTSTAGRMVIALVDSPFFPHVIFSSVVVPAESQTTADGSRRHFFERYTFPRITHSTLWRSKSVQHV